jgi:hypothetical protein
MILVRTDHPWGLKGGTSQKIKYPDDVDEEFVKNATFISMGRLFHRWKQT